MTTQQLNVLLEQRINDLFTYDQVLRLSKETGLTLKCGEIPNDSPYVDLYNEGAYLADRKNNVIMFFGCKDFEHFGSIVNLYKLIQISTTNV